MSLVQTKLQNSNKIAFFSTFISNANICLIYSPKLKENMHLFNKSKLSKLLLFFFLLQTITFAKINLTNSEQNFLKKHPEITLGIGKGWLPYIIENSNGTITGHNVDVVNEITKVSGLKIKFYSDKWHRVLEKANYRDIDGLAMSMAHKERARKYNFSNVYGSMQKLIFTKKTKEKDITTLKDLEGKTLAVLKSNLLELKMAKKLKNVKIILFNTYGESIRAVSLGSVDAMIGEVGVLYVANKTGMPYIEPSIFLDDKLNMVFSIRKDWPDALSIINKSLEAIGQEKLMSLQHKWFLKNPNKQISKKRLSEKELKYLKSKKSINTCIDPSWMPYESFDEKGKHIGLTSDYFGIFRKAIPIPINIIKTSTWEQTLKLSQSRKCDIISLAMETQRRKKYLNFTTPYLKTPIVLATKLDKSFVNDFSTLTNKQKIGIPKGYAFVEILKKTYPNLNIIEVENIRNGLQKVIDGQHFGYIGTLNSIGYLFQREFTGELKIAGKFNEEWELGVAVRNDDEILLGIFNKLIFNIEDKTKQEILNKWITLKYEEKVDYSLVFKILLIFSLIIITFIYWNRKLVKARNKLEQANMENEKHLSVINSHVLISNSDINGVITEVSDALCQLTGYEKNELLGRNHNIFRHKDMPESIFNDMWTNIKNEKVWKGEIKSLNKDGSSYWADVIISPTYDNDDMLIGYNAIRHDITDKKRIEKLSITDKLTDVFNRSKLDDILNDEIKRTDRNEYSFGVVLLDIDNFKKVNDTHGHLVGDKILISISSILKRNIRRIDFIGRWGGEEFLIVCPQTEKEGLITFAQTLRKKIEDYDFEGYGNQTASFGLTVYSEGDNIENIILRADNALYKAKNSGRNRVEF